MLNTHYFNIAGKSEPWDGELRQITSEDELKKAELDQYKKGRRIAYLGYGANGWGVYRYEEFVQNRGSYPVLLSAIKTINTIFTGSKKHVSRSKKEALAFGIAWADKDPKWREFCAYQGQVTEEEILNAKELLEQPEKDRRFYEKMRSPDFDWDQFNKDFEIFTIRQKVVSDLRMVTESRVRVKFEPTRITAIFDFIDHQGNGLFTSWQNWQVKNPDAICEVKFCSSKPNGPKDAVYIDFVEV